MRIIRNVAFAIFCWTLVVTGGPVAQFTAGAPWVVQASSTTVWEDEDCDLGNDCSFQQEVACEQACSECFQSTGDCHDLGTYTFSDLECFGDPCFSTCVCYYTPKP